ncbi:MAG: hypothetical protein JSR98_15590 [Proteobacteria bacterium]|nr:hypothetical protein [Pseudomonadota bacterium]
MISTAAVTRPSMLAAAILDHPSISVFRPAFLANAEARGKLAAMDLRTGLYPMRLAAVLLFALPLAAHAASPTPRQAELARHCSARHLEMMDEGDLGQLMQRFEANLPEPQRRAVQDAVGRRCGLVEGGLTCANDAGFETYRRLGVLKAFLTTACAEPAR